MSGDDLAAGAECVRAGWESGWFWNVEVLGLPTRLVCSEESELRWRVTSAEGQGRGVWSESAFGSILIRGEVTAGWMGT